MNRFVNDTLTDIRHGHESWRVFLALCAPSFVLAILAVTLQRLA